MSISNAQVDELRSDAGHRSRARYLNIPPQTARWAFEAGLPDPATFPIDDLARISERVLRTDAAAALQYGERHDGSIVYGYEGLRDLIAERIARADGKRLGRAGVMLTNGAVHALTLALDAFLNPGDAVAMEVATWQTVQVAARKTGAELVALPMDDDGMRIDALESELERLRREGKRLKVVYTCATFHSPTGICLSIERRRRLLALARQWNFVVLEDNVYGELRYDGDPLPSLLGLDEDGRVLKVDAFSKTVAPALRLGWVSGNAELIEAVSSVRGDLGVSQWMARTMAGYLAEGLYEPHLQDVIALYRRKRDVAQEALEEHCRDWVTWRKPQGGYFFWLQLSDKLDWRKVRTEAYRRGVECRPGERFFLDERAGAEFLRLAFTMVPVEEIERGIAVLGEAMAQSVR